MEDYKINRKTMASRLTRKSKGLRKTPLQQYASIRARVLNMYSGRYPTELNWSSKSIIVSVPGASYIVRPTVDDNGFLIGGEHGKKECAVLLIHKDEDNRLVGELHNFGKGKCGAYGTQPPTKMLALAAWKICYLYNLVYMMLDDASRIHCAADMSFSLPDMYLLKHGKTWYQSILPLEAVPRMYVRPWSENQHIAKTNRWGDVAAKLNPDILSDINIVGRDNDLAMDVFRDLHKRKDACRIFYLYDTAFIIASNLVPASRYIWKTPPITSPQPHILTA
jgi:hypothetical protein